MDLAQESEATVSTPDAAFERTILSALQRFGRRVRLFVFIEGLALTLATAVALLLLQFAIDFLLTLDRAPRAGMLIVVAAIVAHQLWWRLLRPLGTRID